MGPQAFDILKGAPHRFSRGRFLSVIGNVNDMGPNLTKFPKAPSFSVMLKSLPLV